MKIKENTVYKNRVGEIVRVTYIEEMDILYPVDIVGITNPADTYEVTIDGFYGADQRIVDGVEVIKTSINDEDLVTELTQKEYPEMYL